MFCGNDLNNVSFNHNEEETASWAIEKMNEMKATWNDWGTEVVFLDCVPPYCMDI